MISADPFSTSQITLLLAPRAWAHDMLNASQTDSSISAAMTEIAMFLTGDIGRDHLPKDPEGEIQEDEDE